MRKLETSLVSPRRRIRPRGRMAFSLVEVAVVVVLLSLLLAFVASYLVSLHQYDAEFRKEKLSSTQTSRLAETVRADIRQASGVSLPTDQILLIAMPDGREVRYEIAADGCRRSENNVGGTRPVADVFRIGSAEAWTLETAPPGRRLLYMVSLRSKQNTTGEPSTVALFVQAALGADRFSTSGDAN